MNWRGAIVSIAISIVALYATHSPAAADPPSSAANDAKDHDVLDQLDKAIGTTTGKNREQALGLRAVLQYMLGHPDDAASQMDRDSEKDPNGVTVHLRDALDKIDVGDFAAASAEVDDVLSRNPKLEAALLMRGMLDWEMNNGKASETYAKLAALAGRSALGRWAAAVSAFQKKDFAEAVRQADAAVDADPDFGYGYIIRGAAYGGQHNTVMAVRDFEHAVKLLSDVPGPYVGLCMARLSNNDRQQAVSACDTAVTVAPDLAPAHAMRGYAHLQVGDLSVAKSEAELAIQELPDNAEAYLLHGAVLGRMGDNRGEAADMEKVLAIDPGNGIAYSMRCDAYYSMNMLGEAISDCNRALQVKPGLYNALAQRALVESALRNFDAAVADAKAAIASKPEIAFAYINLGKIYADHGDEDLAGATLDKAALLDPGDPDTYVSRASVDLYQHNFEKTFSDARTATRLGYVVPLMSALEGYSAIALGRNQDAVAAFRSRLAQEPRSPYAVIWLALAELKAGETLDDALRQRMEQMDSMRWPGIIAQLLIGKADATAVNGFVAQMPPRAQVGYGCEAGFYTGEKLLLDNKPDLAVAAFRSAVSLCPRQSPSGAVAAAELANLHR